MFLYNTSIYEGTKCTFYELVFGESAREIFGEPLSKYGKLPTYDYRIICSRNCVNCEVKQEKTS